MFNILGIKLSSILSQSTSKITPINEKIKKSKMVAASTTSGGDARVLSPKSTSMKLRVSQQNHRHSSTISSIMGSNGKKQQLQQHQQQHHSSHITKNNNNCNNLNNNKNDNSEQNVINLCSPPSLDGKDVEHIRRFELEI